MQPSSGSRWYDMLKESYYIEPTEVDNFVFEKLVPPDHYLRQVKSLIDFERFREPVKDCYSADMGRTAEDPVRLIKLEFLQFHYHLSDREVVAQAQVNVAFRFFLDLSLESALPVPSLLSQFRTRLGEKRHQALFDEVVRQAREQGLVKDRLRLKDATHLIANIAVPSTLALVAQVRERLLARARPYAPEQVAQEEVQAAQIRLVSSDLKDTERLAYRVAHLREIVAWADELPKELGPAPNQPDGVRKRFEEALALAHKVLSDRDHPAQGDQLRSVVDLDARRGKHGQYYDGYLLDVSMDADSELLTALNVLPANGEEAQDATRLIEAEQQAQGNKVQEVSMDGIGWQGAVLRQLSDPPGLGLEVYVPPRPRASDGAYFTPEQFPLDERGEVVSCPAGQTTSSRQRSARGTGWQFRFARRLCAVCSLLAQCMPALPKGKGRSVIKNDYQAEYEAAWERSRTERYVEVRRQHPRIERKLGDMVRHHGGRRSRYWGRWRVKIQCLLLGMVVNIKRMVKLLSPALAEPVRQAA